MKVPTWYWLECVSAYLCGYCGRIIADLPDGVILWLVWAYTRGWAAQQAAAFLSDVQWRGIG